MSLTENKNCYASLSQRDILLTLITNPAIEGSFFLTGGTALSAFYLYHRLSNDLDLFTLNPVDMSEIDFWVKRVWPQESAKIKEGPNFLSFLIKETKVDFVIDPLSNREARESFLFENGHRLLVDTINNIVSNKLCTLVSRVEPKDFIDYYIIQKTFPQFSLEQIYNNARKKEAIFDDPPTAAFQIEEATAFLRENQTIFPAMLKHIDLHDFFGFYDGIAKWLYRLVH